LKRFRSLPVIPGIGNTFWISIREFAKEIQMAEDDRPLRGFPILKL
jgi:hypothetical protein